MSESSETTHCDADERSASASLIAARATGVVLPRKGRYTTLLLAQRTRDAVLAELDTAIVYTFAADHGFSAALWEHGAPIASIERAFEGRTKARFDRDAFVARGLVTAAAAAAIDRRLATANDRDGYWLAEALGLNDVAWLSSDDLFLDRRPRLERRFPAAIYVEDGEPAAWAIPRGGRIVLCRLSPKRLALLREDPAIVLDLLDAEDPIPGTLDLGHEGPKLAAAAPDALTARAGEPLAVEGPAARVLTAGQVKAVADSLDETPTARFEKVRAFYREACARGEAVLVIVDDDRSTG